MCSISINSTCQILTLCHVIDYVTGMLRYKTKQHGNITSSDSDSFMISEIQT
jgi:hypothetical protein